MYEEKNGGIQGNGQRHTTPAPRRYGPDGQRLWNGKLPEEFNEQDMAQFTAEIDAVLQNAAIAEHRQSREQAVYRPIGGFSIYQLKPGEGNRDFSFRPYAELESSGLCVDRSRYELQYADVLTSSGSALEHLNELFYQFNMKIPPDFTGHSLSVGDVIVLRLSGKTSCHYVDSVGFRELPDFLTGRQRLREAIVVVQGKPEPERSGSSEEPQQAARSIAKPQQPKKRRTGPER